ncbi:primosomal protein DnaI [Paenibacillus sp. MBLB4367]|uniref:primosomal protein DnaI n=1 Tax=Paenibacillus sp. MBLB4367 TaxID=3384767 RepID=UPI00390823D9
MESLGDLLKSIPSRAYLERAEQRRLELLADPLVVKWRQKYTNVTDHDIRLNLNKIHQYVLEMNHCANCPGLEKCPNDLEGHYTMLSIDENAGTSQIYDHKVACRKFTARQSQEALKSRIHSFNVDDRLLQQGYSLDEIVNNDMERVKAVDQIIDYIFLTQEKGLQPRGLYMVGKFGTGKTFLMCYMLHELAKVGMTGAIVYMPEFVEDLKSMFGEPQKLKETIDLLKETDLLVLDDIGAENMNPWLRDHVLGAILNYRMNRKPTFFTSNYELDALEKHFSFTSKDGEEELKGQRIMDRIRPFVDTVYVKGRNKRGS